MTRRMTVELSARLIERLREIAAERGCTLIAVIRDALALRLTFEDARSEGFQVGAYRTLPSGQIETQRFVL